MSVMQLLDIWFHLIWKCRLLKTFKEGGKLCRQEGYIFFWKAPFCRRKKNNFLNCSPGVFCIRKEERRNAAQLGWHGSTPPPPLERLLLARHPPLTIKSCLPAHISSLWPELFASSVRIFFPLFALKQKFQKSNSGRRKVTPDLLNKQIVVCLLKSSRPVFFLIRTLGKCQDMNVTVKLANHRLIKSTQNHCFNQHNTWLG